MPDGTSESEIFPIVAKPGIQRDGTEFDSDMFVNGQWCRFQRSRPKKMGGFRMVDNQFNGPIRTMLVHPHSSHNHVICGSAANLEVADLTPDGIGAGVTNVTPTLADGFVPNVFNTWQLSELYDTGSTSSKILAHAAPNLATIDSETNRKLFFGEDDGGIPFTDTTAPEVSGGVCANAPYAFVYGNNGFIAWCVPNTPDDWAGAGSGSARVTKSKIVYGTAVRGGAGQSPALILWSLDSVIRATFSGGAAVFDFDTISSQSSILSSAGVIEYDGLFFWPGVDRFLMYNGVVQEVANNVNSNFFFDNLNYNQRQKVWATKIPRYGEIWWHFPFGTSTECNAAIIYNIRENTWYDTSIMRSAGYFPQVFRWPLWADVVPSITENGIIRPNSGTPATSAMGTAANAFDGNPATDCTQTSANGNISYDFGVGMSQPIARVGIISAVTRTYDLIFEYSDANAMTWTTAVNPASQNYTADQEYFFELPDIINARAWRVRETGGATLNLAEVFFLSHGYMVHQHEFGRNQVIGNLTLSIRSFIETNSIDYKAKGPLGDRWMGFNRQVMLGRIEPDLIQFGPMTVDVITRRYPRDEPSSQTFPMAVASGAADIDGLKMDLTQQGFLVSLRFQSDTQNGFFEMGEIMIMLHPGDASA